MRQDLVLHWKFLHVTKHWVLQILLAVHYKLLVQYYSELYSMSEVVTVNSMRIWTLDTAVWSLNHWAATPAITDYGSQPVASPRNSLCGSIFFMLACGLLEKSAFDLIIIILTPALSPYKHFLASTEKPLLSSRLIWSAGMCQITQQNILAGNMSLEGATTLCPWTSFFLFILMI